MRREGERVFYDWSETLTEWYVNDRRGLEHGFTVHTRPEGSGLLSFELAVRGELQAHVSQNGRNASFVNEEEAAVLRYGGLTVFDARGQAFEATLRALEGGLQILVQDEGACYPLTIDPVAQQAYLKASNTDSFDAFSGSVAISGDTIVVGAAEEDSDVTGVNGNETNNDLPISGAAHTFLLPPSGPEFANLCNGDGGDQMGCTNCPCMNNAPVGTIGGCLNSAGTSSRLAATGNPSVSLPAASTTDLRFQASGMPPTAFGVLVSGNAVAPGNMTNSCFGMDSGVPFSQFDGLRCAIQSTLRHDGRVANSMGIVNDSTGPSRVWGGEAQPNAGIAVQGGFTAGQTRFFQINHREDEMLGCMRGLNTSQAVEVTFTP